MEISPYLLARMLACSLLLGSMLGAMYDVFRIVRVLTGRREGANATVRRIRIPRVLVPLFQTEERALAVGLVKSPRIRSVINCAMLFAEDLVFFTIAGCSVALLIYYTNDGEFRLMAVVAVALGFVLYYRTLGRLVILAADRIASILSYVLAYAFIFAITPAVCVYRAASVLVKRVKKTILYRKIQKYDILCRKELSELAERGFLPRLTADENRTEKEKRGRVKWRSKCLTEITNKQKR